MRVVAMAVLAALAAAGSARAAGANWEHPDFAAGTARPVRIMVLPPMSDMVRSRVNEGVPLVKETAALETALAQSTADTLKALGYEPDVETLSTQRQAEDRDLAALVRAMTDRVDEIVPNVADEPRAIREGRFTVGESALALAARTGGDGFLIVQSQTIIPSKGQRAHSSVLAAAFGGIPVPPTNITQAVAILVNGHTGDISTVKVGSAGGPVLKQPQEVARKVATDTFRSFPARTQVHPLGKKAARRAAEHRGEVPSAHETTAPEEDVLARYEAAAATEAETAGGTPREQGEIVEPRKEFDVGGPMPAQVPQATAEDVGQTAAPVVVPSGAPGPVTPDGPDPKAAWRTPLEMRPAPTRQVIFQMLDGGPSVAVRNVADPDFRVSIDDAPWSTLSAGGMLTVPVAAGSHRILAIGADGREVARASCIVSADRMAVAELWPL
jgi:hypothetical protein